MSRSAQSADRKDIKRRKEALSLNKIEHLLKNSKTYMGAIYSDTFDDLLIKSARYSYVIYCDHHWFCIYVTEKTFEIFDSVGFLQKSDCLPKNFFKFLKTHIKGKTLYCNPKYQSAKSYYCGYYAVFYILMREMGYTFREICSKFSTNYSKNDQFVRKYIKKL